MPPFAMSYSFLLVCDYDCLFLCHHPYMYHLSRQCLWNDAVHCSPYHPRELYSAQIQAGVAVPISSKDDCFFEIPLSHVLTNPTAVYMYEKVANEVLIGMHVSEESSRGVVFLEDDKHEHHDFATFSMPAGSNDYFQDPSQFVTFSPSLLREIVTRGVPTATTQYYKHCANLDCLPLTFFHVPHVLIRGEIQVGDCRIVKWSDE